MFSPLRPAKDEPTSFANSQSFKTIFGSAGSFLGEIAAQDTNSRRQGELFIYFLGR